MIVRTDNWLETDFDDTKKICEKLLDHFHGADDPKKVYSYLKNFGMYKPDRKNKGIFEKLKIEGYWNRIEKIFIKYKRKWNGPDIPIFIFPMDQSNARLMREGKGKSGLSFIDKMFLFLSPIDDERELEALFVHEYHHVCRMKAQKKNPEEYTLLDSMILEGLAEHAVAENCGVPYTGEWSKRYSTKKLADFWGKDIENKLSITRKDRDHDEILFGLGSRPRLLGYAIGYELVKQYKQYGNFTEKASFKISSSEFTKLLKF
ncbi:DUF2268 domain-containing protein [Mesobacillus jeotgali]|uniref:DUF2268 domain-containing protein n=1 Tax=Mesobacillus jeotgali TaxID=129985 RepID=A0ABY9VJK5_9BACI|nr:DUF2268 domain-containing protein [Mesobacillus jeotgali]WNF24129.1 DUF2268 domain-containing protein [Mesobacillus jeotgali]